MVRFPKSRKGKVYFNKSVKVVAFDCDGVLFDTLEANKAFYNHILKHFGKPDMNPEQFAFAQMHTVEKALAFLFPNENNMDAVHAYRAQMNYVPLIALMEIEPNLKSLLKKLRPHYKTAVATNRTDTIERVLTEFELKDDFDFVVCSRDVERPKPYPDMLNKVAGHFRLKSQHILYVGDSELDQKAAHAAETIFVAYRNRTLDADLHISTLKDLEKILQI